MKVKQFLKEVFTKLEKNLVVRFIYGTVLAILVSAILLILAIPLAIIMIVILLNPPKEYHHETIE